MYRVKKSILKNGRFLLNVGGTVFNLTGEDITIEVNGKSKTFEGATQEILERVAKSNNIDLLDFVEDPPQEITVGEKPESMLIKRKRRRKTKNNQ